MIFSSRAAVRRAFTSLPDAGRMPLAAALAKQAVEGELPPGEVGGALIAYLLDRRAGAILATSPERLRWLAGPLFGWVGPGNAAPLDDQIAALIVGPVLGKGTELAPMLVEHRFAPRADDAVALAVAALDAAVQASALEKLFADPGPEPELLALSTLQCGRVLAWSPQLCELAVAERIVDALLALLDSARPRPLLELAARALGPLARVAGPLGERIRRRALAGLDAAVPPRHTSFAAELAAIGKPRTLGDQDRLMALPAREVAAACAYVLGFAAPEDREAFADHRAQVIERPDGDDLMVPFVDGLVAAAHVPAISELVAELLTSEHARPVTALMLAALLPLDPLAPLLVEALDWPSAPLRALAAGAVELLDDDDELGVDAALAARLADPSAQVAAAAVRVLLARDRRDVIADHATRESQPVRRAVVLASLGELEVPVIGELVRGVLGDVEAADSADDAGDTSPIAELLADCLLGSLDGIGVAAELIAGVPEAAGLLALGAAATSERDIGVLAPADERAHLADVVFAIAKSVEHADDEIAALAMYVLARNAAGDDDIAHAIADALTATEGHAGNYLAALGEVRVADAQTAAALAPFVAPDSPIAARVAAAGVCGRALPRDHAAWAHVRELLDLGTIARAAAWSALRDRVRRQG